MLARTQLLRIQRALYEKLRAVAQDLLGPSNSELRKYYAEYHAEWRTFQTAVPYGEIQKELLKSDLVLAGDYHTLAQAQRAAAKLIESSSEKLTAQNRKIILALEFLSPEHKKHVDAFLSGALTEEAFLKAIRYDRNWGFPWENYRPLFELAREKKVAIRGIHLDRKKRGRSLHARDDFAAKQIARFFREDSNPWVFVLIGDLHLTPSHLGKRLARSLRQVKKSPSTLTILQNHEPFYWKLAEKGLDQFTEALKIDPKTYCLMNTPPWVKLQSHLKWMDVLSDFPEAPTEFSLHGEHRQPRMGTVLDAIDHADDIQTSLTSLEHFLGLESKPHSDFSVTGPGQRKTLAKAARSASPIQRKVLALCLKQFKSHFIPGENIFFFSTLSLNHTASQSAVYLHSRLSGFQRLYEGFEADFFRFVWVEALAFFGSKVINHRRKCQSLAQLREWQRQQPERKFSEERWLLELAIRQVERPQLTAPKDKFKSRAARALASYKASKLVGRLLGEAIYHGVMTEKVSPAEVKALFQMPLQDLPPDRSLELYSRWARRLNLGHG